MRREALGALAWSMTRAARAAAAADAAAAAPSAGAPAGTAQGAEPGAVSDAPAGEGTAAAEPVSDELPLREAQPGDIMVIYGDPILLDKMRPNYAYSHVERTKQLFLRRMGFSAPPVGYVYERSYAPGEVVIHIDDVPVHRFTVEGVRREARLTDEQAATYARELAAMRIRYAASLFGVPEVTQWLKDVEPACGRLATDIQQLMPLMTLVDTLRRLLDDGVGLVPPRLVLEGLAQSSQRGQDPDTISEAVRGFLRRQISHANADAERVVNALVLAPDVEATLRQIAGVEGNPTALRNAEAAVKGFVASVRDLAETHEEIAPLCLMTPTDLRRPARRLLKQYRVDLPVLGFSDLAADYEMRTVALVTGARAAA